MWRPRSVWINSRLTRTKMWPGPCLHIFQFLFLSIKVWFFFTLFTKICFLLQENHITQKAYIQPQSHLSRNSVFVPLNAMYVYIYCMLFSWKSKWIESYCLYCFVTCFCQLIIWISVHIMANRCFCSIIYGCIVYHCLFVFNFFKAFIYYWSFRMFNFSELLRVLFW